MSSNYKNIFVCVFVPSDTVQIGVDTIHHYYEKYNIPCVYVYDVGTGECLITFNVYVDKNQDYKPIESSFTAHRNSKTNTIYTINALNKMIRQMNNGKQDPSFVIDWSQHSNTLITTDNQNRLIKKSIRFKEKICV